MRIIVSFLTILIILFSASACSKSNDQSEVLDDSMNLENAASEQNATEPHLEDVETELQENNAEAKDVNALVPAGWTILMKDEPALAEGDLNKDGIEDVAAIIEQLDAETDEAPPRALLIAFGTSNDSYTLSIIADKVVLKADEGGIWGDPFESLSIDRGSVIVSDYGGSNWRWYNKYRFRFQDNDWYLIGATMGEYFTGNATQDEAHEQDYNLLTGDYHIKKTNEKGENVTERGNRGIRELVKLKDFDIGNI
jgi:hypothetical protein